MMTKAPKSNGEIAFPQYGEGNFLKFTVKDLIILEEEYGDGNYFSEVERLIDNASAKCIMNCIDLALKKKEGGINVASKVNWDDPGFALSDAGIPILDAICATMNGMTYEETLEIAERQRQLIQEAQVEAAKKSGGEETDPFPDLSALDALRPSGMPQA